MTQKLADFIVTIQGLRKFIVMVLLMILGIVFRMHNLLSGGEMVDLLKNTVVAFMAANSVERIGETIKHYITTKLPVGQAVPADQVTVEPVTATEESA